MSHTLRGLFGGGRADRRLVALFTAIHGILLFNALIHDPGVGYDAGAHLKYVETLAQLRLPSSEDTLEFFSPPLPYLLPGSLVWVGVAPFWAMKCAQLANVLCSMALCLLLLKICESLRPGATGLKVQALGLLGMLPVYYRTFAFVRGEPLLATAAVFTMQQAIVVFIDGSRRRKDVFLLGLGLGLAILSRQMGFFLYPPVVLLALATIHARPAGRRASIMALSGCLALSMVIGGWYYAHLRAQYGSMTVINREPPKQVSFSNQPPEFYTDLALDRLFSNPVRDSFPNRLLPIFYSEVWGDYWCYFVGWARDKGQGQFLTGSELDDAIALDPRPDWLETNLPEIGRYLGRVNLVSLLPSAVLLAGCLMGFSAVGTAMRPKASSVALARAFLVLVVVCAIAGYMWFLIAYPSPRAGRTIKATFLLQIFPPLCLLAGDGLQRIRKSAPAVFRTLTTLLVACALHNLPVLFTHIIQ